ncbi:MAG TPA: DUF885 domain-containing protein [Dermatophilaceae bacterium]|nr:DUF885 domain-containing protein [Dermatophilaceae bacterium]
MTDDNSSRTDGAAVTRPATELDRLADAYFDADCALHPIAATHMGVAGHDTELDDFSPAGRAEGAKLRRATLAQLDHVPVVDDVDAVTLSAMRERLGLEEELDAAGLDQTYLNVIASPLQEVRSVFDLMGTGSAADRHTFAARMDQVPAALDRWVETLLAARDDGDVAAARQVRACIEQCREFTGADGYFSTVLADVESDPGGELAAAVARAAAAYEQLGRTLEEQVLPHARSGDAFGRERYQLLSRYFLGATVDLEETYAWGQAEVARLAQEMATTADKVKSGATVPEAIAYLDDDPAYRLEGTEELQAWMQGKAEESIAELSGSHFDIPAPIRRIECRIAPTHTGGIYYTGPSENFSRPGRMWWSVPRGVTSFGTWRELTTVYHEGVPGHHLQVAQTVYRSQTLNRWRRMGCWVSGHGEGWALYAERLMEELGFMDDPGNRLGLLASQSLRAARVVLDIGVHCGMPAPEEVGGGEWDYDKAWSFLSSHAYMAEGFLRFELDRYLGWPGQAPSYKIGERLWLQLRDEAAARAGDAWDVTVFHRKALDVGSVGLDTLREAVLR